MTGRVGRAADTKERRRASGQRVHFEAMVAVGGAEGGAAFEAESVDVSSEGMRLRTAYLPSVGDRLVCRFDGSGTEVVAVGEVLWATEESKGGEFGLKFVDLDAETEQALRELCFYEAQAEPVEREEPAKPKVAKNARVKLHIEGLASPMKARVRDGDDKEVCVGSSLEFLKLGRQVEVEDVDVGDRREGFVDAVKVEVDPTTSIPQLVVSLRFDAAAIGGPKTVSVPKNADAEIEAAPVTKVVPSKRVDDAPKAPKSVKKTVSVPPPAPEAQASDASDGSDDDDDAMMQPNKLRAAQEKAKDLTSKAAAKIGPAFAKVGDGAKGIWSTIRGTIDKRREARDEARKASAPRRVTAPPPSGALTSEGRRVVRQDQGKDEEEGSPLSVSPKRSKKGIVLGAAAGLALVIGVVGVSKAIGSKSDASNAPHAAAAERKNETLAMPPIPGAAASVNMPLYGPSDMTTTRQVVPTPPPGDAKAAKGEGADKGDKGDAAEGAEEKSEMVREWGHGEVHSGKPFTVRMDGPIEGFVGSEEEDGFSITVPKTRSKSTGSALVRKDPRLSAVDVVNREDGSEIHVKFKGEPPPYKVKVRGDKLEIAFGKSGSGKAESKKGETKKVAQKSDKKKNGKGDKKKAGNKAHAGHR